MLMFVDYEWADRYDSEHGQRIQAARTWITYRLEDLSGHPTMLVRHDRLTDELIDRIDPVAVFISGNSVDPNIYPDQTTGALARTIRDRGVPVFGFCGGWQCIALALGAPVVPIDVSVAAGDSDIAGLVTAPSGAPFEYGYHPIELDHDHPLLEGLGASPVFRHAHGLHVPDLPAGFASLASTAITPVQLAVDDERRMVGTQFHPEYWTDEHPEGRTLIANFLRWVGVIGDPVAD